MRQILIVGPVPPPAHGVTVMTALLLDVLQRTEAAPAPIHVDTSDPRALATIGRFDFTNVWLALKHYVSFLRALLRFRQADVYVPISQNPWAFMRDALYLLAAKLARRRRYVHLHGGYFQHFHASAALPLRLLMRAALRGTHQAWVLTPGLCTQFDGLIPRDRVHVVENAVEDVVNRRMRQEESAEVLRILFMGYVSREKGSLDLIQALEQLEGGGPGLHVRFVGELPKDIRQELEARGKSLAERNVIVEFAGPTTTVGRWREYEWADVAVIPIRNKCEGQPLVLLESLAAGLPIVTTRVTAIVDTVGRDESAALVVPVGRPKELAQALKRLQGSEGLRATLGGNARLRYESRYKPARFRNEVVDLISNGE